MRLHSGTVRVTSTVGVGSRFIVTIPTGRAHLLAERLSDAHTSVARPEGPAEPAAMPTVFGAGVGTTPFVEEALRWLPSEPASTAQVAELGASTREARSGEASGSTPGTRVPGAVARILVADDNADMRTYLTRLLGEHWTVEAVVDGTAALSVARARPPDLLLADIMMPGLDGIALVGALRADAATTAIPVVLLSARAGEEAIIEGLESGAVDYLVKPFAAHELLARVRAHLELARLRRKAVEYAARLDAIFEAQADGIAVFDTQGQFVQANRALAQILGYDPDSDYTTRPFTCRAQQVALFDEVGQRIPNEQWPHWRVLCGEKLVGASAMDARLTTIDGREIWISITSAPVRRHDGHLTGVVLVTRDVTARRALEQQTQAQASQLKAIFEALADGIGVFDQQRRLVRANPAWQVILQQYADATGQSADPTFTALPLADQVSHLVLRNEQGEIIPREQRPTSRALRGETITSATAVDEWVHSPTGQAVVVFSVSAAPIRDDSGQVIGAVTVVRDVTSRRQLERQVAEQAGQLEAIFGAMADGVLVVDREGQVVRANRAWQALFRGFSELSGMSREPGFAALPFAQQIERWNAFYRLNKYLLRDGRDNAIPLEEIPIFRALRGETVTGANAADERVEAPDGHVYEVSVSAAPMRDAAGNITGAVAVTHNVTAHRQLERQVREQAAQLEAIFAAMADGVFAVDTDGQTTRMNPAGRQLIGARIGDGLPTTGVALARELDLRDGTGRPLQGAQLPVSRLLRGEVFSGETALTMQMHGRDGQERIVSLTGSPLRDGDGQITGAVGVMRDVTQIQQLQAALAEQEQQFRTLVENMPDYVTRHDPLLRMRYANPRAQAAIGISLAARAGKTFADLGLSEALYAPWERAIRHVFATGEPYEFDVTSPFGDRTAAAQTYHYRMRYVPEFTADGAVASVLGIASDVTAHRELERQVQAHIAQAATEAERARLARELHDTVTQEALFRQSHGGDASARMDSASC